MDRKLLDSYVGTNYRAEVDGTIIDIRIGQRNTRLDRFGRWAFISASNPKSVLDEKNNVARHEKLLKELDEMGYGFFEGWGIGDDGKWPPEKSVLVAGISREEAVMLGRKFGQNAIVFGESGKEPELVFDRAA